ncbi:histone H1 [Bernardetia sp. OM2101]|uniref:histone H1 n=1 Tax=Bernardetia sp. OM2101 TaxID=3344876 RepID=UPI0035D0270E
MGRYQEVEDLITELKEDFSKFYDKENQAAGTRIRKGMQDLKKLAQEIRTEVQETKNKRTEAAKK